MTEDVWRVRDEQAVAETVAPFRRDEQGVAESAEPLGRDEQALAETAEPLGRDEQALAETAEPLGRDEQALAETAEPLGRDEQALAETAEPLGRDEQAVREIVEQLGRILADWGLPRMAARVLFVLMTAHEPSLSAGELAERLGASPAAISGAVRYLTHIRMVARDPVPGSRRDRYRLVDDSWYEVTLEKMTLITTLADIARQGVVAAGGEGTPAGARLAGMRDFYDFVQKELPVLLERWQKHKAAGH